MTDTPSIAAPNGVTIRDATPADMAGVAAIYAEAVRKTTATFETEPPDVAEMEARRQVVIDDGLPYLVAELDGRIVGYAYAGVFRRRAAYAYTVEDSVYLAPDMAGKGIGRALLSALIARCEALGHRLMVAVIGGSTNTASIALHRACGFTDAGGFTNAGWKHGRWVDIVFMERPLGPGATTTPDGS